MAKAVSAFLFSDKEMKGQKSRNLYHDKGFWLSYDIEILFDIFFLKRASFCTFP